MSIQKDFSDVSPSVEIARMVWSYESTCPWNFTTTPGENWWGPAKPDR